MTKRTLRFDAIAGLSGAILVLPQAIAYATIAGMPVQYGIYAAMVPAVVAALFGSSWHLVSGPTATVSIVVFSTLSPLAVPGSPQYVALALALTFVAGACMLIMGIMRLGSLVNFVSHTVVIGFTAGAAVLIATSQLQNFFGLRLTQGTSFADTIAEFFRQLANVNGYVTAVAVVTLLSGLLIKRYAPRLPYMITAMLIASVFAAVLDHFFGNARTAIQTVGALAAGLPPLSTPDLSFDVIQKIGPSAVAVALLGLTEALSIARAVASKSHQRIDGNQEFIGQGLSNIFGSLFSAYATSGSFTRSGLNYDVGAKTPLAAVFAACFLLAIVLFVAPLAAYLPVAAMAGVLLMVAYGLIDVPAIRSIIRTSRAETAVLAVTFVATLLIDLQFAIYLGVMLSLMLFLNRTSRPAIQSAVPAPGQNAYHFVPGENQPECCQLKMVFIDGPLYFGAVDHVQRGLLEIDATNPTHKHLLILAPGINLVDAAGMTLLADEATRRREMNGGLYFHRLKPEIVSLMRRSGAIDQVGEENLFNMGPNIIDQLYPRLDSEVCRRCKTRIFRQCNIALPNGEPRADPQPATNP
ncbi:MAG: SulP family inorganic anion transporter [Caldimonas sp.]